jgi:hypothetical protein
MKCDECGFESPQEDIFLKVHRSFRLNKLRFVCLRCAEKSRTSIDLFSLYAFLLMTAVGIVVTVLDRRTTVGPLLLNLSLLQVFVFVSTVLHELGHIAAAHLAGLRVFGIEIGYGRVISEFRFGGLRWQFRAFPFGGYAHGIARDINYYRLKETLFIVGGPLVNALLLILAIITFNDQDRFTFRFSEGIAPATMLFFANGTLLIYSLWPHETPTRCGKLANDALLLWRTWRLPASAIREAPAYWYFMEADECRRKGAFQDAQRWIDDGLQHFPENYPLEMLRACNLLDLAEYRESLRAHVILLARYKQYPEIRTVLVNNIAFTCVLTKEPGLLDTADRSSKQAFDAMPWSPHYKGTRGAVLTERAQYEEGLALLHDALRTHPEKQDRAIVACLIARAEARRGNSAESTRFFALARSIDPQCGLLPWASNATEFTQS